MTLTAKLDALAEKSQWDFSNLRALFITCTLKKSPELSNTQGLGDLAISIGFRIDQLDNFYAKGAPKPWGYTFEGRALKS